MLFGKNYQLSNNQYPVFGSYVDRFVPHARRPKYFWLRKSYMKLSHKQKLTMSIPHSKNWQQNPSCKTFRTNKLYQAIWCHNDFTTISQWFPNDFTMISYDFTIETLAKFVPPWATTGHHHHSDSLLRPQGRPALTMSKQANTARVGSSVCTNGGKPKTSKRRHRNGEAGDSPVACGSSKVK